jgi:hypothetical protein
VRRGVLFVLAGIIAAATARAESEPARTAEDQFRLGGRDEADFAFAPALEHYRACLDAAPGSRWARKARGRIAWLEERSEGNFAALSVLARVRARPSVLDEAKVRDQLAAETESLGPGLVRSELRLRIAEARLRQSDLGAAVRELRRILDDPSTGSPDAAVAEHELVTALVAAGDIDAAKEAAIAHPWAAGSVAEVDRLLRRRFLRRASCASSLALLVLGAALVALARRRRSPLRPAPG